LSRWCFSSCSNKNRVSFSRQEEQNKSKKTPKTPKTPEKGFKNFGTHLPAGFFLTQKKKPCDALSLSLPLIMLPAKTPTKTGDSLKSQRN
jgi:hypothetical protein